MLASGASHNLIQTTSDAGTRPVKRGAGRKPPDSHRPLWTADQLREKLRQWDRTPFQDLLGAWLECSPTPEALTEFADRYPDRYASSLLSISRIAGFAERRELTADIRASVRVEQMSDSQLEDFMRSMAYQLGIPVPKAIELRPIEAGNDGEQTADQAEAHLHSSKDVNEQT